MLRCVWYSQVWGWGCSGPRVGGGHRCYSTSSKGPGRRPTEGDAAPNSKSARAEEHRSRARDRKQDKRRKRTDRWKVLRAKESAAHMEARAGLHLCQHSKNEISQAGSAPKPETQRQAAHLARNQAGDGPWWLPVDAPGAPEVNGARPLPPETTSLAEKTHTPCPVPRPPVGCVLFSRWPDPLSQPQFSRM